MINFSHHRKIVPILTTEERFEKERQDRAAAIKKDVCRRYGLELEDLIGPSQRKAAVAARYEAIRLIKKSIQSSSTELGRMFGRDHTTILYALGRVPKSYERKKRDGAKQLGGCE